MRFTAAAAFLLCLAGCAGDDGARVVPPAKVSTTTADAARAAALISEYRKAKGLGPVTADAALNGAAIHQARAVAEAGRLSHGDFSTRMALYKIGGHAAENLTAGPGDIGAAVGRWKASPGHNENLLLPQARRIGLARAESPGYGYERYWALVLAQ